MLGMWSQYPTLSLFQVSVLIKKKKKVVLMTHMFVKSERAMFTPEEQARRDVKTGK